ncbi:MAG: hypothetical protein AABX05_00580 [Nanoarchaeota archaeon]
METILIGELKTNKEYQEALTIVKSNSKGKIWLIGGIVSRSIIKSAYGNLQLKHDIDFLVEKLNDHLVIPPGWKETKNKFNNPKLIKEDIEVDIVPLGTSEFIRQNKLKPSIKNFLAGTPLDIQSLAFDIQDRKLIGDLGIKALQRKEVRVNNSKRLLAKAQRKNLSPQKLLQKIAKSLGFKAIFN